MLSTVSVFASGATGEESIQVAIEGATVLESANVSTDGEVFKINTAEKVSASDLLIRFTNDLYQPEIGFDRNLTIEKVEIDGVKFLTSDPTVFSTGTWLPVDGVTSGFGRGNTLHANGFFQYDESGSSGIDGSTIVVNAQGDTGEEQFVLIAGGQTFAAQTISSSQEAYVFETNNIVTADSIRIEFINDLYDPANGVDRNLTVDNIIVDGVVFDTKSPDVESLGGYVDGAGPLRGFVEVETLFQDGYFQYNSPQSDTGLFVADDTFGESGFSQPVQGDSRTDFARSTDGKLAISTRDLRQTPEGTSFVATELHVTNADGSPDSGFGENGISNLLQELAPFIGPNLDLIAAVRVYDLEFDSQNRIVAVGEIFYRDGTVRSSENLLVRLNPDGKLDNSFAAGGKFEFASVARLAANQISIDANDRIVVAGSTSTTTFGAIRLDPAGTQDFAFGDNGTIVLADGQIPGFQPSLKELEHLPDGSIVIVGGDPQATVDFSSAIFKFDSNGQVDSGFGNNGRATVPEGDFSPSASFNEFFNDATIDNEGRIIVAGQRAMWRYTAAGQIDTSFGNNGLLVLPEQIVDSGQLLPQTNLGSLDVDSTGRIVSVMEGRFLVRINPDGSLDTSLSDDAYQKIEFSSEVGMSDGRANSISFDEADRLTVSGNTTKQSFLGRYVIV